MIGRRGPLTLAILDDHQLMLDGLGAWLALRTTEVDVSIACRSWRELTRGEALPVDVVLMDRGRDDDVPVAVRIVTLQMMGIATVIMSRHAAPGLVRECISAGALGFVPKSEGAATVLAAILAARRGETYLPACVAMALGETAGPCAGTPKLSEQERRVLVLYASGLPLKSVARRLNVGYETAKSYIGRVREKYAECGRDAGSKIDLSRRAVEDGLISGYRAVGHRS